MLLEKYGLVAMEIKTQDRKIMMARFLKQFWNDQSGATSIEYGLIAALVSITILTAATNIGGGVEDRFDQVDTFVNQ